MLRGRKWDRQIGEEEEEEAGGATLIDFICNLFTNSSPDISISLPLFLFLLAEQLWKDKPFISLSASAACYFSQSDCTMASKAQ